MATGGWGAVGGGAWGATPQPLYSEEEPPPPTAPPASTGVHGASTGAYGAYSAPSTSHQPELATISQRGPPVKNGGFGSTSGAYGQAAAGGQSSFNSTATGGASQADAAVLKRKEVELAAKEKQLKELESKLNEANKKNWPICYPILYHNINEEIPEKGRRVVRGAYLAWWGLVICLLWNVFCASVMLGFKVNQKVPSWFLAVLYLILGVPLSWYFWYRQIYNAVKSDSALRFVWFFFNFAVHTAFCIWATIAVPFSVNQWSFAGFVTAFNALDENNFAGTVYLVGAGCWGVLATWSCWVIVDTFMYFRGKGGIKQAKEEQKKQAALTTLNGAAVNNNNNTV